MRWGHFSCWCDAGAAIVVLTCDQVEVDDREANEQFDRATRNGWHRKGFTPKGGLEERRRLRIAAFRAERAAAVYLGVEFERDPNGFGKPDVAGYQVRFRSRSPGLPVYDTDGDDPYLLVRGTEEPLVFRVRGQLSRARALELKEQGVGEPGPTIGWFIPEAALLPIRRRAPQVKPWNVEGV